MLAHAMLLVAVLIVLVLVIRMEVRQTAQHKRVCRMDELLHVWVETWGQPADEVKKLLKQITEGE